jgi:hypothetical protein
MPFMRKAPKMTGADFLMAMADEAARNHQAYAEEFKSISARPSATRSCCQQGSSRKVRSRSTKRRLSRSSWERTRQLWSWAIKRLQRRYCALGWHCLRAGRTSLSAVPTGILILSVNRSSSDTSITVTTVLGCCQPGGMTYFSADSISPRLGEDEAGSLVTVVSLPGRRAAVGRPQGRP